MKSKVVWVLVLALAVMGWGATQGWLAVFDGPGGSEVGTWAGDAEVLLVDGQWAMVQMSGWVRAEEVAADMPEGQRIPGSPGNGLWVRDITTRTDFVGDVQVMGRIINATGQDFHTLLIEVVTLDRDGSITGVMPGAVSALPAGAEKAFSVDTMAGRSLVHDFEFQFGGGF